MTGVHARQRLRDWLGLLIGALAWALNTQLGQILPDLECKSGMPLLTATSFSLAMVALGAASLSFRAHARQANLSEPSAAAFAAMLSILAGGLFAFALMLQGGASLVLSGCER